MAWTGTGKIKNKLTGSAGLLRLGDFVVPKQLEFEFTGDEGTPDFVAKFEVRNGRPECVELTFRAKPDGRGIRTSDLHVIQIDGMKTGMYADRAMRATVDHETNVTTMEPVTDERELWRAINEVNEAVKAPQRGITRPELEQVAKIYRENVDGSPVKAVQASMNYNSERTAARRVEQAREHGLLPATTPGKRKA